MEDSNQRTNESSSITKKETHTIPTISTPLLIKFSIGLGVFLTALDMTTVMMSIFKIQIAFNVSGLFVQLVSVSFLVILIVFMNISKQLGETYTSKKIFQIGLTLVIIGSLISSFSTIFGLLIVGRIIQGLGASGVFANANSLLVNTIPSENEKTLINWNNILIGLGIVFGPILGSLLVFFFGWQSVFLINIPFGILSFLLVTFTIPTSKSQGKNLKLDYYGIGLFTIFVLFVSYGIFTLNTTDIPVIIMAIIFIVIGLYMAISFYFHSKNRKDAFINFNILNNKSLVIGFISTFIVYAAFVIILYQLPILIQQAYYLSVVLAGIIIATTTISWFIVNAYAGKLVDHYDPKNLLPVAYLGLLFNFIAFIVTTTGYFYWFLTIPFTVFLGVLIGVITAINERMIFTGLPKNKQTSVRELLFLTKTFGFILAIIFSTVFLVNALPFFIKFFGGANNSWYIYIPSYQSMLLTGCALAFAGMVITFKGPRIQKELENNRYVIK